MIRRFRSRIRGVAQVHRSRPRIVLAGITLLATVAPATVAAAQLHTIAAGETLSGIAALYGVDIATIAAHNEIEDPDLIYAGQSLTIPTPGDPPPSADTTGTPAVAPVMHTVAEGDTLAMIAAQYGVSVLDLAALNGLADPNFILPGQMLTISGAASAPLPPSTGAPVPSEEVRAILQEVEVEFGIQAGLLQALAWQESGWQQHVISHAGAVGVTQVLPITALWALEYLLQSDADWESSARDNARVGASVMRHYLNLTAGDVWWSLAAYYQGWQSVQDFGPFEETRLYVDNVLALWAQFQ